MVFARGLDDHLARLVKELNGAVTKPNAISKSFVAFLADDPASFKGKLAELAKQHKITIPLSVALPKEGIESYTVPADAWVAAVAYKEKKVVDTMVFKQSEFDAAAIDKIVALVN